MLFMSIPAGSRAQHTGTRGKESSHWESALVSTQDIFGWKRGLVKGETFRWNIQEQSWEIHITFSSLWTRKPFQVAASVLGPSSYTGSGASWLTLPFLREKPVI